ncbi:MAG: flagellar hook-basal body complex protein FliE [Verrucomicrobia bacterium]|nr:flagellar hook-basal body complex protein FliE [Verrucomicrobiota bacterium]
MNPAQMMELRSMGLQDLAGGSAISPKQLEALTSVVDSGAAPGVTGDFSNLLGQIVREVQAKQANAGAATAGLLSGQGVPLHQAVLASEEASVAFQLMVEVRNKLLEAYQELMRMQV